MACIIISTDASKSAVGVKSLPERSHIKSNLPADALYQFAKKCLIDEIKLTNDIEGIYSTRKELSSVIEKYFDKKYFQEQKIRLEKNMFDTNYALKGYLNEMSVKQLSDFGCSLMMAI